MAIIKVSGLIKYNAKLYLILFQSSYQCSLLVLLTISYLKSLSVGEGLISEEKSHCQVGECPVSLWYSLATINQGEVWVSFGVVQIHTLLDVINLSKPELTESHCIVYIMTRLSKSKNNNKSMYIWNTKGLVPNCKA